MQRKCQGCNKTFTPPNYSMMRCRSCAKGVGYPKKLTEAEIKERKSENKKRIETKEEKRGYTLRTPKEKKTPKQCVVCGKDYMATSNSGKYCSQECRKEGKRQYCIKYNEERRNERKRNNGSSKEKHI